MKSSNKDNKFHRELRFVRPLYKNARANTITVDGNVLENKSLIIDIDSTVNLNGGESRQELKHINKVYDVEANNNDHNISGKKVNYIQVAPKRNVKTSNIPDVNTCFAKGINEHHASDVRNDNMDHSEKYRKSDQTMDTWLRILPAPKLKDETMASVLLRCVMCQMGLLMFLILWTIIWIYIINFVEEPYEQNTFKDFQYKYNQLIIDLATELRQITPTSMKWLDAIESRLEEGRMLSLRAYGGGVRLESSSYWSISSTFIYAIYVLTVFGYGAPTPQTVTGKISALSFAVLAWPLHLLLMLNTSRCVVAKIEAYRTSLKQDTGSNSTLTVTKLDNSLQKVADIPNFTTSEKRKFRQILLQYVHFPWTGRGLPVGVLLYYVSGAIAFGVLRNKVTAKEVLAFPSEFTATGGLDLVSVQVRLFYGLYIEGAFSLTTLCVITMKKYYNDAINRMTDKFRLSNLY